MRNQASVGPLTSSEKSNRDYEEREILILAFLIVDALLPTVSKSYLKCKGSPDSPTIRLNKIGESYRIRREGLLSLSRSRGLKCDVMNEPILRQVVDGTRLND